MAVHRGGVDPINAELDCESNGRHRFGVVLASPTDAPEFSADGPRAESCTGDLHSRMAEGNFRQRSASFGCTHRKYHLSMGPVPLYSEIAEAMSSIVEKATRTKGSGSPDN